MRLTLVCRHCKIALVRLAPIDVPQYGRYDDGRVVCTHSPTCAHEPEAK